MRILANDVIEYFRDNPCYLNDVVEILMLDELLAGECSSTEFFLNALEDAKNGILIQYHKSRLDELNGDNQ